MAVTGSWREMFRNSLVVFGIVALCGILSGAGAAHAEGTGLWVSPLEIDFGPVGVGSTSPQAVVTITNNSATTLNGFAGGGVASPFSASQNCAAGVAPGGSCSYFFTFTPTAEGEFSAVSSSGTSHGSFRINIHGTGVGAKVVYDAHSLDMGSVYVGGSATQQAVTLRNVGMATLSDFAGGGVASPFSASQNCAGGVAPGASCQYFFNFSPEAIGSYTATSSSSSNGGPVVVSLKGSGRSIIFGSGQRVSPLSLDFGPVGIGDLSPQLAVEVKNQSSFSEITGFAGGGVASPFSATQNCAGGVAALGSCNFFYRFSPTAAGEFTTTSSVSDSFGSFSIQLHGTGVAPSHTVSPLWLDFGPVATGTTSPVQVVTITNTGLGSISGWAGGGVSAPFSASQNCAGLTLEPGESCNFYYRFTPTATGFHTAQSNVSTNAGGFRILLQGGDHLSEYSLGVAFSGTGGGAVNSSPAGLSCGSACSHPFSAGTPVTLTAEADEYSLFGGWSGICGGSGSCTTIIDGDKSVTALFEENTAFKARIGAAYYATLATAYAAASASATIQAWGVEFSENLACNVEKAVTLKGGYSGDYSTNGSGYTYLRGNLTIGRGSLVIERLIIL